MHDINSQDCTFWACVSQSTFSGLLSCLHIPPLLKEMTDLIRLSATETVSGASVVCAKDVKTSSESSFRCSTDPRPVC